MVKAKTIKITIWEIVLLLYDKPVSSNKNIKYIAKMAFIIYTIVETRVDTAFVTLIVQKIPNQITSILIKFWDI